VQSLVALALAVSGTFERLAILANVAALALYLGCALAAWRLRALGIASDRAGFRVPMGGPLGAIVPWLACLVILWVLTSTTPGEWLAFGACMGAGTLAYLVTRGTRTPAAGAAESAS
jgi:basic amino acid/polyamine antiporter, APA family